MRKFIGFGITKKRAVEFCSDAKALQGKFRGQPAALIGYGMERVGAYDVHSAAPGNKYLGLFIAEGHVEVKDVKGRLFIAD